MKFSYCSYVVLLIFYINLSDLITLSSEGSILRAWNLPDGQMWWESFLQGPSDSKSFLFVSVSDNMLYFFKLLMNTILLSNLIFYTLSCAAMVSNSIVN
jgi:hypothetical protein